MALVCLEIRCQRKGEPLGEPKFHWLGSTCPALKCWATPTKFAYPFHALSLKSALEVPPFAEPFVGSLVWALNECPLI